MSATPAVPHQPPLEKATGAKIDSAHDSTPAERVDPWHADRRRTSLWLHFTFLVMALAVIVAAAILHVDASGHVATPWSSGGSASLPALCFFRRAFNMDCPGCGLTRCFVSAAHGNLAQAWMYHPVGLLLFGIVLAQIPFRTMQMVRLLRGREEFDTLAWAPWLAGTIGVLMIGQWVVRMIV